MVSGEKIIALLNAYYNEDSSKIRTIALQIAAEEAKKGHTNIAKEIKELVNKNRSNITKIREVNRISSKPPYMNISYPDTLIENMILSDEVEGQINKIINEFKNQKKLQKYGLTNRRKILLIGPPGTGKTMTSSVIASELSLPLYSIQLDQLLTKFLGETSKKLREVFNYVNNNPGVYLFDEFDAIGSDRSMDNEIGEMRRILNTFLVLLEKDSSNSLLISATNNPQLLDEALFRRFDEVIHYFEPNRDEIYSIYHNFFINYDINLYITKELVITSDGLSHAEILNVCNEFLKDKILTDINADETYLINLINKRKFIYHKSNKEA